MIQQNVNTSNAQQPDQDFVRYIAVKLRLDQSPFLNFPFLLDRSTFPLLSVRPVVRSLFFHRVQFAESALWPSLRPLW
jgi:hypothetical protein